VIWTLAASTVATCNVIVLNKSLKVGWVCSVGQLMTVIWLESTYIQTLDNMCSSQAQGLNLTHGCSIHRIITLNCFCNRGLLCFDTVGWAAGRASGL